MGEHARIEGVRPIIEAIRARRRRVHGIEVVAASGSRALRELEEIAERERIPISSGPRGGPRAVAVADPYPEEPFEQLLLANGPRRLVALDRVTDVGNLGSIARSAEVAGYTGLVLEHRNAPAITPGALRASAGSLEYLRVGRTPNLRRALELARSEGLAVLAAREGGTAIGEVDPARLAGDHVWVFGSEDRGLRGGLASVWTDEVGIPQSGRVASLGVAAAAAYLLLRSGEVRRSK